MNGPQVTNVPAPATLALQHVHDDDGNPVLVLAVNHANGVNAAALTREQVSGLIAMLSAELPNMRPRLGVYTDLPTPPNGHRGQ